jgi:hypothetical protein
MMASPPFVPLRITRVRCAPLIWSFRRLGHPRPHLRPDHGIEHSFAGKTPFFDRRIFGHERLVSRLRLPIAVIPTDSASSNCRYQNECRRDDGCHCTLDFERGHHGTHSCSGLSRGPLASDPSSPSRHPTSLRAPNGGLEDSFYQAIGRPLYDGSSIVGRVLIVRSGNDFWSRPEDAETLANHWDNAKQVSVLTLSNATHFVHLDRAERGRAALIDAILAFLAK